MSLIGRMAGAKALLLLALAGGLLPLLYAANGEEKPTVEPPQTQAILPVPALPGPGVSAASSSSEKSDAQVNASQFIDVARLVLEHNRDAATSTVAHFDRTINILVFAATAFAAIFAVVGWVGWNKVKSLQDAAKVRLADFNAAIDSLHANAAEVRDGYSKSLDASLLELRAEINCRIELLTARAEIANAENSTDANQRSQGFASAIARIERALQLENLSSTIRIKGLADLGYAKKRNGDLEGALRKVMEAEAIAAKDAVHMVALLAYNAACYSALLNRNDTCAWLEKAIAADAATRDSAGSDVDLASVRNEPWFQVLMTKP